MVQHLSAVTTHVYTPTVNFRIRGKQASRKYEMGDDHRTNGHQPCRRRHAQPGGNTSLGHVFPRANEEQKRAYLQHINQCEVGRLGSSLNFLSRQLVGQHDQTEKHMKLRPARQPHHCRRVWPVSRLSHTNAQHQFLSAFGSHIRREPAQVVSAVGTRLIVLRQKCLQSVVCLRRTHGVFPLISGC